MTAQNNLLATTSPAVTDNASKGYGPGSMWINTAAGAVFICTAATIGKATWAQIGWPGGGSGGTFSAAGLPIEDPEVEGAVWNNEGILTVSAGEA